MSSLPLRASRGRVPATLAVAWFLLPASLAAQPALAGLVSGEGVLRPARY